jgi:trk system potassium uptake protein TrkA
VRTDKAWIGARVRDLESAASTRVAYISRMGEAIVPVSETVIQDGDVVHVMARSNDVARINDALATRVEGAE